MCRRHTLVRTIQLWPMGHGRCAFSLYFVFWLTCFWILNSDHEISDHARSDACWCEQKEKWPTGNGRCADVFFFMTCSVSLLWNSVQVNRERCKERRCDKRCIKKMQKQMHEHRICTRSCMEKYVGGEFAESQVMPNTPGVLVRCVALEKLHDKRM